MLFMRGILAALVALLAALSLSSPAAAQTTKTKPAQQPGVSAKAAPKAQLIDINTATQEELESLPGIGKAYAGRIIEGRPYHAKNDLVRRKILPQSTYDGVKDKIVAHQAKSK